MFDPAHIKDFAYQFLAVLFEGLPYIFVGTLISGFIDVYLPSGVMDRFLPKKKWLSILVCGLMGLILPVCECTVVPVIRRLVGKGLPVGSAFAYMLAAPIVNPITFLSTWTAFEGESMSMAMSRMGIGYLVAVFVGMVIVFLPVEKVLRKTVIDRLYFSGKGHSKKDAELDDLDLGVVSKSYKERAKSEGGCCGSDHKEEKLVGALRTAVKDFMDVSVYFTVGVMLMIIFNTAAGQDGFLKYVSSDDHEWLGTAFMMGLSFILSLCSTSDAFLVATSFDAFGRVPKMAFLVYGPMMDMKLVFLYQTLMRSRAVLIMAIGLFILVGVLCYLWGLSYESLSFTFPEVNGTATKEVCV